MRYKCTTLTFFGLTACAALASTAHAQQQMCPAQTAWDLLQWPLLAINPSENNPTGMCGIAPQADLIPLGQRNQATEKRIVLFGDLMPMQKEMVPRVHAELRALFASADLIVGNVESPVHRGPVDQNADQTGDFNASTGYLKSFLSQYCADPHKTVFTIANNHSGDHGGWPETVQALVPESVPPEQRNGALAVRGVVGKRPASPTALDVFDLAGLKVGVVGWTQVENTAIDNAWRRPQEVYDIDWKSVKQQRGVDLLIGAVHWDRQFYRFPQECSRSQASQLVASGFDLVLGDHPSVLQPAQLFGHDMVFHSLSSINANFSATATNAVYAAEIIVDAQGRVVRYKLHAFAQRKVSGSLPAVNICPDGRLVYDVGRPTDYEIVPLREISNFWGVRSAIEDVNELLFPSAGVCQQ